MEPERLLQLQQRAARAYELGRLRLGLTAMFPLAVGLAVLGVLRGAHPLLLAVGAGLVLLGVVYVWRGQSAGRAFLPGLAAGLIPTLAANLWMTYGHLCVGGVCLKLCLPVCGAAGTLGGVFISIVVWRRREPFVAAPLAGLVALAASTLGCTHLGVSSLASIAVGMTVGALVTRSVTPRVPATPSERGAS